MSETAPTSERRAARPNRRQATRRLLVQALYQWRLANTEIADLLAEFREADGMRRADAEWFEQALRELLDTAGPLASHVAEHLDRDWSQVDPVEQSILLLGAYELSSCMATPYRVVINEGVELARVFGATDSHRYINGVLDKLARAARPVEVGAARA